MSNTQVFWIFCGVYWAFSPIVLVILSDYIRGEYDHAIPKLWRITFLLLGPITTPICLIAMIVYFFGRMIYEIITE